MGFGSAPAGGSPAGLDLPTTTEARVASTPAALELNGDTLDFVLDASGRYKAAHPIDTKVFNRLRIRAQSMRSAPATGSVTSSRRYINPKTIDADIRDDVNQALADMFGTEIEDRGIELDASVRGRVMYRYLYVNLQTGKAGSVPLS